MNYPVWDLGYFGGGLLIAVIAIVHVYVAHFAVGGGLFLVLTERKGHREKADAILAFVRRHTKFFMLLTLVFSNITGVGIWFTISLLSPEATSILIHTFVFGWAIEWVFFTGEITALLIYYYTFDKMDQNNHLRIGWFYFLFAWLSLFVINGIVAFMLTPGKWLETRSFWDGFFNPSMWPSMFFRTTIAFMYAGIFGFITAVFIKEKSFRNQMVRYCAKWVLFPFILLGFFLFWYMETLPEGTRAMVLGQSPEIVPAAKVFIIMLALLFLGSLIMAVRSPGAVKKPLAFILLLIGLLYMGAFEYIREAGRRPYLIPGVLFSNSVRIEDVKKLNQTGFLKHARWSQYKEITDENTLDVGRALFRFQCAACHSVGGPMKDILPRTSKFNVFGLDAQLNGLGKINNYMPAFFGTRQERLALARYIVEGLHQSKEVPIEAEIESLPVEVLPFDEKNSPYVLLAWSRKGIHTVSDSLPWWRLSPPGNTMFAQLIRRGETPEIVTSNVEITFSVESGMDAPADQVKDVQSVAKQNIPKGVKENIAAKSEITGKMVFNEEKAAFIVESLPLSPYRSDGTFNPYSLVTLAARDRTNGAILAETQAVAPVTTEMGCKNCHGGNWRISGVAGISEETAKDVLVVHDRISKTALAAQAENGNPVSCRSCHRDDDMSNKAGDAKILNLSASMHGFHANYLTDRGAEACHSCHPASAQGHTRFLRGIHFEVGLECVNCHGTMADHALNLLAAEIDEGKKTAERLAIHLKPKRVTKIEDIIPRRPWKNEPDCLNCHVDFAPPEDDVTFNQWTKGEKELFALRTDEAGIMCAACHGSPHAEYPANNIYGEDRDNLQPLQYQKNPYPLGANRNCRVCHTIDMEDEYHHPNSLAEFRNIR